ncbi:MAG: hypothetical protein AAGC46_09925, partial [Solirubrobacteraceae bacterium]|nr:hypothetical protein [Patulibacter sp.]
LKKYHDKLNPTSLAFAGGFVCGEAGICKTLGLPGRETAGWLLGEIGSDIFDWGQIRDFFVGLVNGNPADAGLAAAGLIPIGGTAEKVGGTVLKFVKRAKIPLNRMIPLVPKFMGESDIAATVLFKYLTYKSRALKSAVDDLASTIGPDSGLTRKVLDKFTNGAYGSLRGNNLSHLGVSQLIKSGNDIENFAKLSTTVLKHDLTGPERSTITANITKYWTNGGTKTLTAAQTAEAQGIESTIRYLRDDDSVTILVSGRPDSTLSRAGPDVVAKRTLANGDRQLIVAEAKGTTTLSSPMSLRKLQSKVGGRTYVQPSPEWLRANRSGASDYMAKLKASGNAGHQEAHELLDSLRQGHRNVELVVVQVRPDAPGSQAYGSGVDAAARILKQNEGTGHVGSIHIVDVPF